LARAYDYLLNNDEMKKISDFFRKWMRTCFTLNGKAIFELSDEFSSFGREKQKHILTESSRKLLTTFQLGNKIKEIKFYNNEDDKFFNNFAKYVNKNNLGFFVKRFDDAIFHIERNGNPKLIFSDLSFDIGRIFRV
jgi:DNA polymerase-3 subunit delta'